MRAFLSWALPYPLAVLGLLSCPLSGCSNSEGTGPADASADGANGGDATIDVNTTFDGVPPGDIDAAITNPCALPGSIQYTNSGVTTVPGGMASTPDMSFLKLPPGYCAHYFGNVGNARQLRFAPGGELFVASPTTPTTGGGPGGQAAIMVLPDDNHDGYADTSLTFLSGLPSTQGLMFTPGYFYYQDATTIKVLPYQLGQRKASGSPAIAVDITVYVDQTHWPKVLDVAPDGTVYVTNGGDQLEGCDITRPFHGGILKIDGSPGGAQVAKGLRNPIALRCEKDHDLCFALELALDYSGTVGGREKLIPVHQGDDWGFACCATTNLPYGNLNMTPPPDCSAIATEIEGFAIGDTPFGIDFEPGNWPAPYTHSAFVTLHGTNSTWAGERLIAVAVDPTSGMPQPGNDLMNEVDMGGMGDFATGWDDGTRMHGRPAAVSFSADGRLFVASDTNGTIFWIAPMQM